MAQKRTRSEMSKGSRRRRPLVEAFNFPAGRVLLSKYKILSLLGAGWEGEVYLIQELFTGIERTAKFFFPHRNVRDRAAKFYAQKLHKLRHCPLVIQYHTQETIRHRGLAVTFLVSDYVEGELLSDFLKRQPGGRLSPFQALHLLHSLAEGLEYIHEVGEYHGDLHSENIIVRRYGLGFELQLLDMFYWQDTKRANIQQDVVDLIRLFYEALGGRRYYARQPPEVKAICCGLKQSLILTKFRTAGQLRRYLETMAWA